MADNDFDEIVVDDDLEEPDLSNNSTKENIDIDEVYIDIELPLDDESKRKLQRKDIISANEQYDVELDIHEENIPITTEVFQDKTFEDSVQIKFPKEIIDESKNQPIPLKTKEDEVNVNKEECDDKDIQAVETEETYSSIESETDNEDTQIVIDEPEKIIEEPNVIKEVSEEIEEEFDVSEEETGNSEDEGSTYSDYKLSDLDEKTEDKEFISRHELIFEEKNGLEIYKPSLKNKNLSREEVIHKKNNLAMMFVIIISTILVISAYFIFINYEPKSAFKYNLSQETLEMLTEEYLFITSIEGFLIEINQTVEKERILIDSYVSDTTTKEEILKELEVVLTTKENLKALYYKITPIEENVLETKKLSDKIFKNTIDTTVDIIDKINNSVPKHEIIEVFNSHIDTNNSNIYMYNQYVQSVFRSHGISVTLNGDKFVLDTSWLEQ